MIGEISHGEYIDLDRIWRILIRKKGDKWITKFIYDVRSEQSWEVEHATEDEARAQIVELYGKKLARKQIGLA